MLGRICRSVPQVYKGRAQGSLVKAARLAPCLSDPVGASAWDGLCVCKDAVRLWAVSAMEQSWVQGCKSEPLPAG